MRTVSNKTKINRCTKCAGKGPFYRDRNRNNGLTALCKTCCRNCPSNKNGTLAYFKLSRWKSMNQRTVNGTRPNYENPPIRRCLEKGTRLELTKQEFYAWCDTQERKILGLFRRGEIPSVDRRDPLKHYSLDNMRIMECNKNRRAGAISRWKGRTIAVVGTHVKTGQVVRYKSMWAAEIKGGFRSTHIGECLRGKQKTHAGFRWVRAGC